MIVLSMEQVDEVSGGQRPASFLDGLLVSTVGRAAGTAGTAFVDGVISGAEVGEIGGPWGVLAGAAIGGLAAWGAYELLSH